MGYWIKKFVDNTIEKGADLSVKIGSASWSKGRLNDMISAEIYHIDQLIKIEGFGNYWQSDTFESVFPSLKSTLLQRRVQKQIDSSDTGFRVLRAPNNLTVSFNAGAQGQLTRIAKSMYGKWLTVELDLKTGRSRHFIANGRL